MIKTSFVVASFLALTGFWVLWMIFFKNDEKKKAKTREIGTETDKDIKKVKFLIEKVERENPEMVKKIRSQFAADVQLKKARGSEPEDIGKVIKHWLSDKDD